VNIRKSSVPPEGESDVFFFKFGEVQTRVILEKFAEVRRIGEAQGVCDLLHAQVGINGQSLRSRHSVEDGLSCRITESS